MQQMKEGAEGAMQAISNLANTMQELSKIEQVSQAYGAEDETLSPETVQAAMDLLPGLTERQAYENPELVRQWLDLKRQATYDELNTQTSAMDGLDLAEALGLSAGIYSLDDIIGHVGFAGLDENVQSQLLTMA